LATPKNFFVNFNFYTEVIEIFEVVVLAAGNGSRMGDFTSHLPKSLIPLNGIPIIDYILKKLFYLDIHRIIFVVGYQKDKLINYLKENYSEEVELVFVTNDQVERENGYSLFCARDYIKGDRFLLLMADHVVDTEIYKSVCEMAEQGDIILATDSIANLTDPEEATKVLLKGNRICKIGKNLDTYSAIDTGVFAMSKTIFSVLEKLVTKQYKIGISDLVTQCIKDQMQVLSCDVSGYFWMDLDTKEDIELLLQQLAVDEENTESDEIL